jgi:hypothetical protein
MIRLSFACILVGLLFSCIDEKDYKISSLDVNPSISLPLTLGSVSIKDFLSSKDSAYLKTGPDGLLSLVYSNNLASQDVRGLFKLTDVTATNSLTLPETNLPEVPVDLRLGSVTTEIDLGLSPEQLSEINFKTGQLIYTATLNPAVDFNYEVIAYFPDLVSKTTNQPFVIQGSKSLTIPLSNYLLKLNKNKFALKIVFVVKKSSTAVTIPANTTVSSQVTLSGMDFTYIKGFLGEQSASIPTNKLDIGAYKNSLSNSNLSFAQPSVNLVASNDYGVPLTINYNVFEARKAGASPIAVALNPANPVLINSPTTLGASAITTISITNTSQVIDYAPTQFYYSAVASINKGVNAGENFMADTSKLRLKMNVNIPLYGSGSGITLADTIAIDLSNVNQSQIEEAALKIKLENEIPLDGTIQFSLTDKNYTLIDQLLTAEQTSIIKGSSVDSSGELKTIGISNQSIPLAKEKLNKIFLASYLVIKVILSTSKDSNGNTINVKFKSQYKLNIESGISAKLNFNVKL